MILLASLGLLGWAAVCALAICLIITFTCFDTGHYGSSFWCSVGIVIVAVVFWKDLAAIFTVMTPVEIVSKSVMIFVAWMIAGVVTSFFYWVSTVYTLKEKVISAAESIRKDSGKYEVTYELWVKARAIKRVINQMSNIELVISSPPNQNASEECQKFVDAHWPPKFKDFKGMLIQSAIIWPITAIWLISHRLVKQVFEAITNMFGNFYNQLSKTIIES